jgi:ATP phosphoribosyltransferase
MKIFLTIAIQKKGRLTRPSLELLREAGLGLGVETNSLRLACPNFPAEVVFLRDDDIPKYIAAGAIDIGFAGQNIIWESGERVREVRRTGLAKVRLVLAAPKNSPYKNFKKLNGATIVTEYPNSVARFLKKEKITAQIKTISGSAELAPSMGVSDVIADLVDTGTTLREHGLIPFEPPIFESELVLIANQNLNAPKKILLENLTARIDAVIAARGKKYVLLNAREKDVEKIEKLLPALDAPTVLPLAKKGECAIHTIMTEAEFWQILPELKKAGAKDIVVLAVEKMVR